MSSCAAAAGLPHSPISHRTSSECSSEGRSEDEETRSRLINRIVQNDTEGYSTVEAPRAEGTSFSLPAHLYPDEVLDDLTISPYASFTSLSEPRPTMLSGWLDKLSPQGYVPTHGTVLTGKAPLGKTSDMGIPVTMLLGAAGPPPQKEDSLGCPSCAATLGGRGGGVCEQMWGPQGDRPLPNSKFFCHPNRNYVFQRRYVRFDGKNLMYFSSEKVRRGRMRAGWGGSIVPLKQGALTPHELPYPLCLPLSFCKEPALLYHRQGGAAMAPVPGRL